MAKPVSRLTKFPTPFCPPPPSNASNANRTALTNSAACIQCIGVDNTSSSDDENKEGDEEEGEVGEGGGEGMATRNWLGSITAAIYKTQGSSGLVDDHIRQIPSLHIVNRVFWPGVLNKDNIQRRYSILSAWSFLLMILCGNIARHCTNYLISSAFR